MRKLADDFYRAMADLAHAKKILDMHPENIDLSSEKLALFLCGWLGGPRLFREKWGPIAIPTAHKHLSISEKESDAWLDCMQVAVEKQNWKQDFKKYFLEQIRRPALMVKNTSA